MYFSSTAGPYRSGIGPHYRAVVARQWAESHFFTSRKGDEIIRGFTRYLVAVRSAATLADREAVGRAYPAYEAATAIRFEKSRLIRDQLEALILARRSVKQISEALRLQAWCVRRYRELYWTFGVRINDPEYVFEFAVQRPFDRPTHDRAAALRRATRNAVAYFLGPQALSVLAGQRKRLPGEHWRLAAEFADVVALNRDVEGLVLAMLAAPAAPLGGQQAAAWAELRNRLAEGPLAHVATHIFGL